MGNVVVIIILVIILGLSISKVISEKRKGVKCIGCPHSKSCGSNCNLTLKK